MHPPITRISAVFAIVCGVLILSRPADSLRAQETIRTETSWAIPSNEDVYRLLASRMARNSVGIVVGIIDSTGTRVIAYGRSGASNGRALDGDTVFQIGSLSKLFTTLLLADMVQRAEVGLHDPASKYLPQGVTMPERGRPIALLDLATHMSGLPSMPTNFPLQGKPDPYAAYSAADLYNFLSTYQLPREPGAEWQYSNLGVALLGRLLGNRMGMEYEPLLRERILKPLGMASTSVTVTRSQAERLAPGHDIYLRPVDTWELLAMPASGSLRSTANDLLKFLAAYLGYLDTPLKSALLYQREIRVGTQVLGWRVGAAGPNERFGHDGGKEGYRSSIYFQPSTGRGVVVLANANDRFGDSPGDLARFLLAGVPLRSMPRQPAPRIEATLSAAQLDAFAGRYRLAADTILTIARKENHLLVDATGGGVSPFYATGPKEFFSRTGDEQISFQTDSAGKVTGAVLHSEGVDRTATPL